MNDNSSSEVVSPLAITEELSNDLLKNNVRKMASDKPQFTTGDSDLFLSLKSHIDFQCKLNQLNQNGIRSLERFRKYCQTLTSSSPSPSSLELINFDQEQFRNEYNRFDRNYRYWRKRIRKLRKQTKSSLLTKHQNPYDTLYELLVKIESFEQIIANNEKGSKSLKDFSDNQIYSETSINPSIKPDNSSQTPTNITKLPKTFNNTQETVIDCNFHCFVGGCGQSFDAKNDYLDHLFEHSIGQTVPTLPVSARLAKKKNQSNGDTRVVKIVSRRTRSYQLSNRTKSELKSNGKMAPKKGLTRSAAITPLKKSTKIVPDKQSNSKKSKPVKEPLPKSTLKNRNKSKSPKKKNPSLPVFKCEVEGCSVVAKSRFQLKIHQIVHSDLRPFQCAKCLKSFKYKHYLSTHDRMVHDRIRYGCPFEGCSNNYSTERSLGNHIELIHQKSPPGLHCPVEGCNYSTHTAICLKRHSAVHSDNRPFKCMWPGCGKAFKLYKTRQAHLMMHKNERQFKCKWPDCSYACNTSNNLRKHHAIHEKKDASKRIVEQSNQPTDLQNQLQQQQLEMTITVPEVVQKMANNDDDNGF